MIQYIRKYIRIPRAVNDLNSRYLEECNFTRFFSFFLQIPSLLMKIWMWTVSDMAKKEIAMSRDSPNEKNVTSDFYRTIASVLLLLTQSSSLLGIQIDRKSKGSCDIPTQKTAWNRGFHTKGQSLCHGAGQVCQRQVHVVFSDAVILDSIDKYTTSLSYESQGIIFNSRLLYLRLSVVSSSDTENLLFDYAWLIIFSSGLALQSISLIFHFD